jgi:hypothetical protein
MLYICTYIYANPNAIDFTSKQIRNQSTPSAEKILKQGKKDNMRKSINAKRVSASEIFVNTNTDHLRLEYQRNMANVFSASIKHVQPDDSSPQEQKSNESKKIDYLAELNDTDRIFNETTVAESTIISSKGASEETDKVDQI